jgi:hypothetical protein
VYIPDIPEQQLIIGSVQPDPHEVLLVGGGEVQPVAVDEKGGHLLEKRRALAAGGADPVDGIPVVGVYVVDPVARYAKRAASVVGELCEQAAVGADLIKPVLSPTLLK